MAITIYCKACDRDVPAGERCPTCGAALKATGRRVVWSMAHDPILDWLKWNEVARILLPAYGVLFLLLLLAEGASGGMAGVMTFLPRGLWTGLLILFLTGLVVAVGLLLQGRDVLDVEVDNKGVHQRVYLPRPTALKLLMRLKPLSLLDQGGEIILLCQTDVAWKDVARVQLWHEKTMVLLYAPFWLLRLRVRCDPFQYEDVLFFIREKLGKKRAVMLPPMLRQPAAPRKPRSQGATARSTLAAAPPAPDTREGMDEPRPSRALRE